MNENQSPENQSPENPAGHEVSADQWAAAFQQRNHREPTLAEYQEALRLGRVAAERRPRDPALQQMADGARQVAAGAKGFFNDKIAPAIPGAANPVPPAPGHIKQVPQHTLHRWMKRAPLILPAAALLTIISLFLPIASVAGYSLNFFSEELEQSDGPSILTLMLIIIGLSIASFIVKARWLQITTGVTSVVVGLIGVFDSFGNMSIVSSQRGTSVGIGLVLLALLSVVIVACGILILLSLRRK